MPLSEAEKLLLLEKAEILGESARKTPNVDQVKALYSAVRTPQEAAALRGTDPALVNEVRHLKQMHNKHELTIKGSALVRGVAEKYAALKARIQQLQGEIDSLKIQLMELTRLKEELARLSAELEA